VREPHHGDDQHVEHGLLLLDVVVEEPLLQPEARVVDQQVDGPVGSAAASSTRPAARGRRGRRAAPRPRRRTSRGARGDRLERAVVAGDQDQVVAAGRELAGELEADAGVAPVTRAVGMSRSEPGARIRRPGSGMMVAMIRPSTTTLAVANQKGGVAKTTSVASLARTPRRARSLGAARRPRTEACLTVSLGTIDRRTSRCRCHHVLHQRAWPSSEVIVETEDGVDRQPATIDLARARRPTWLTRTGSRARCSRRASTILRGATTYDWVLLDCRRRSACSPCAR
jgi:hypothetical protein